MQKPHTFCLFLASDLGGLGVLAFIFNAFCQEIMTRGTGRRPVIWDRKHGLAARATWFSKLENLHSELHSRAGHFAALRGAISARLGAAPAMLVVVL
jgi:hypothetical protein